MPTRSILICGLAILNSVIQGKKSDCVTLLFVDEVNKARNKLMQMQQEYIESLPPRKNCISSNFSYRIEEDYIDENCSQVTQFQDWDCRQDWYFGRELFYESHKENGWSCNNESGQYLRKQFENWCDEGSYCVENESFRLEEWCNEGLYCIKNFSFIDVEGKKWN